jgi:hypothetical protein
MKPGPILIIACPECDFLMAQDTAQSWNTFGARHWSNGKVDAPMRPNYPEIAKCGGCRAFFWVEDAQVRDEIPLEKYYEMDWEQWREKLPQLEIVKVLDWEKTNREPLDDSKTIKGKEKPPPMVRGLTLKELNRAINKGFGKTKEKELYLRTHLWWAVNDKETKNKDASIKKIKQSNFIGMEPLLSQANPEDRIMKAEIKRQSGDFQEALKYLTDLPEEYHWVSEQIKQEINMKNTKVFELKLEE